MALGLCAAAEHFEILAHGDVGAGAKRRILRHLREDLVGAIILLQPLIDVAEGDEREAVIGIEIEAEAQIDDGGQFVALRVADDAETVEQFGRAVLRRGHAAASAACRSSSVSMAARTIGWRGSTSSKALVERQRFVPAAALGKEARIGIDHLQRVALALIGRLEPLLRLGRIAEHVGRSARRDIRRNWLKARSLFSRSTVASARLRSFEPA